MGSSIDLAISSATSSLEFSGKKWRGLLLPFAKVYAAEYGIFLLTGIIVAIAMLIGIGSSLAGIDNVIILGLVVAFTALVAIPATAFSQAISMVAYKIVDASGTKTVPIMKSAWDMMIPAGVYLFAVFGAITIVLGVFLIIGLALFSAGPLIGTVAVPALLVIFFLFATILGFFLQFAPIEIAINGADGIGSIRRSYALVRRNMASVFVFDLIMIAFALAIGIVFSIINQVLSFAFALASLVPLLFIAIILVWFLVFFIQNLISGMLMVPMMHRFWKAIGGKR
jgi:hypothetical protein